jgi:D-3-phosphoglycerate dehydrogenase
MPVALVSAPFIIPVIDRFRPMLEARGVAVVVPTVSEHLEEADLLALAGTFDGTICGDDRYTPRVLEACAPRLKVICKWGTGIDSIDQEAAARLGIAVTNTPNAHTLAVSEAAIGFMLSLLRRQPWLDRAIKSGGWEKIQGRSLAECTLGVIGVGNIGKAVIRRARAFGAHILGNDIVEVPPDFIRENAVEMVGLDELLRRSDVVSLNCDLNPTSHHLIDARGLALMKPDAILVNTARGPVVDERALIAALQAGAIAGAGLDVFEVEPLPQDSPLLKLDNVLLSPHHASSSPEGWERIHRNTIRNLLVGLGLEP